MAALPAAGTPGKDVRSELDIRFDSRVPGSPTGVTFHVLYKHPDDPQGKPPPITAGLFELPPGTRIDGGAAPACKASDAELRAGGRDACPAESRVGAGALTAITGAGAPVDPVHADVTVFNGGDQLIELVTAKDGEAVLGMDRLTIEGSALRAHPPATPGGPPDGRTAIREIEISIPARGRLLVTPAGCPAAGVWTSRGSFEFGDGGRSQVATTTPCTAARPERVRTRLFVRPRRVSAGRRVRFRARVRSSSSSCARHATRSRGRSPPADQPPWTGRGPGAVRGPWPARGAAAQGRLPAGAGANTRAAGLAPRRNYHPHPW